MRKYVLIFVYYVILELEIYFHAIGIMEMFAFELWNNGNFRIGIMK